MVVRKTVEKGRSSDVLSTVRTLLSRAWADSYNYERRQPEVPGRRRRKDACDEQLSDDDVDRRR